MTLRAIEKYLNAYDMPAGYPWVRQMMDEIEAEVDERYLELPCDYNGAPIHIGDVLTTVNGYKRRVDGVFTDGFAAHKKFNYYEKEHAKDYIHAKPDAVKELLREVWDEAVQYAHSDMWQNPDVSIDGYAERIREAVGE